jgi:hypothetical protein
MTAAPSCERATRWLVRRDRQCRLLRLVCCCTLLTAVPSAAQESPAWPGRVVVAVDLPFETLDNAFAESLSFPDSLRKTENVVFTADYESTRGAQFGAGVGVRVAVTTSWFRRSNVAAFDLKVPNPTAANRPFDLPGSVSGLERQELGVHVHALYALGLGKNVRVMLSGGPSVFKTNQDVVQSIEFDKLPGFTGLKFDQAFLTRVRETAFGYNVGADITWAFTPHLGLGTVTRYSRAALTLDPGSTSGLNRAIEVTIGGLQVGGGIRLLF